MSPCGNLQVVITLVFRPPRGAVRIIVHLELGEAGMKGLNNAKTIASGPTGGLSFSTVVLWAPGTCMRSSLS